MKTISDCGLARLLVAIDPTTREQTKKALGVTEDSLSGYKGKRCIRCRKKVSPGNKTGYCQNCMSALSWIDVACSECEKLFNLRACYLIYRVKRGQQLTFCSRSCHGNWLAKHHGFTVHPENQRLGVKKIRKWDWDLVWQKHLETGYGALRLSRILNIPVSTIELILRKVRKGKGVKANG